MFFKLKFKIWIYLSILNYQANTVFTNVYLLYLIETSFRYSFSVIIHIYIYIKNNLKKQSLHFEKQYKIHIACPQPTTSPNYVYIYLRKSTQRRFASLEQHKYALTKNCTKRKLSARSNTNTWRVHIGARSHFTNICYPQKFRHSIKYLYASWLVCTRAIYYRYSYKVWFMC